MKRVIFSVLGTVTGLAALLSFKTHSPVHAAGGLPSAGLPGAADTTPAAGGSSTPAPATSSGAAPKSSAASATKTSDGDPIQTQYGIVQVEVTVSGNKIQNVKFLQLTAFDGRSAQINNDAAPMLLQETLDAQSAQIDTVSGATYTSEGYIQSLQSALDRAGFR